MQPLPPYLMESPDGIPWLTFLLLVPLIGVALVGLAHLLRLDDRTIRMGVTAWMLLPIGIAVMVWAGFDAMLTSSGQGVVQFVERVPWVEAVRVDYFVGVDGISLPMVLLTVVMAPIAAVASFQVTERVRLHYAMLLLLEMAMLGFFLSLDFFFFFIFWETSLIPAFFLIQMWGGGKRSYAAFKFFVYTVSGSLGMLLAFQILYLVMREAGVPTFDIIAIGRLGQGLGIAGVNEVLYTLVARYAEQIGLTALVGDNVWLYTDVIFWVIFVAFAVKLGVWPLYTWLPDAYSEAPVGGSILLSAVMSKMGAYGMLRIMLPFTPASANYYAPVLGGLALIGIVAGAFGALSYVRGDIKRLISYTSINHMGYVMLAIAGAAAAGNVGGLSEGALQNTRAMAMNGALLQMVAHGLSTGALFLLAGWLYQRTGTYNLSEFGGLRTIAPMFAGLMGIAMFANLGLPGLAGFMGEFFIFRGAWVTLPLFTLLATIGLVVTALALLLMYQNIFHGPPNPRWSGVQGGSVLPDLNRGETLTVLPLLVLLLVLGINPALIMNITNTAATQLVSVFERVLAWT
jgi:NADH-quinone oxidoreductase subunit M